MKHHHDDIGKAVQATHRSLRRFFVMVRKASSTLVDSIADVSMKGIPNLFAYACHRINDDNQSTMEAFDTTRIDACMCNQPVPSQ